MSSGRFRQHAKSSCFLVILSASVPYCMCADGRARCVPTAQPIPRHARSAKPASACMHHGSPLSRHHSPVSPGAPGPWPAAPMAASGGRREPSLSYLGGCRHGRHCMPADQTSQRRPRTPNGPAASHTALHSRPAGPPYHVTPASARKKGTQNRSRSELLPMRSMCASTALGSQPDAACRHLPCKT